MVHFLNYINENDIILDNHHGGQKYYCTTTALIGITHNINKNLESNKITATMSTDLTAPFDTVDSKILLKKLEYYGVKNMELKLF